MRTKKKVYISYLHNENCPATNIEGKSIGGGIVDMYVIKKKSMYGHKLNEVNVALYRS